MILNSQRRVRVDVGPLADFLERVRRELRFPKEGVTVRLVSDAEMTRLNESFRGKRGTTDVLSFPANGSTNGRGGAAPPQSTRFPLAHLSDAQLRRTHPSDAGHALGTPVARRAGASEAEYVGDIAISPAVALRNARSFERSLPAELRILILHGMIHLAGYDHERDHGQMDRLERRLRRKLGLE